MKAASLVTALNKSIEVKDKVEECAQELSSVNEVLKQEVTDDVALEQVEQALDQSENVEHKVRECADDLAVVNEALAKEVRQRKVLERKLANSNTELADTLTELSDTQSQEKEARHRALHDVVTGLPNRSLFSDRLKTALALAKRHSWRLALMFIDLDKFKNVNDTYGHDAGDKVLKMVGERLQASVRGEDSVGRQGGDEFLYLMLEVKDENDVARIATKIVESIAQPCELGRLSLTVEVSIGIALYPKDGKSANLLIKNADSAMYAAKRAKTRYAFYDC